MIRYVGGKTRHAKAIAQVLSKHAEGYSLYIEPFFGGGSMARVTSCLPMPRLVADIDHDLIQLYLAIQAGWRPPERVTETEYQAAKTQPPSPLRTYIGYACSYGGKWFGGMARDATGRRDLTHESYLRICRDANALDNVVIQCCSYESFTPQHGDLVYCDPPYAGTLGYKDEFNHSLFWQTMREWSSAGAKVFISEYQAPSDFTSVWCKSTSVAIHNQATNNHKTEHLWAWAG